MPLSEIAIFHLTIAIVVAVAVFYGAYSLPQKYAAFALIVIIPFQPAESHYFTANILLAYGVFIAFLLRGGDIKMPMLPQILLILFCYLLSFSQVHPATYLMHAIYVFWLIAAFLVFWIAYDVTFKSERVRSVTKVFFAMNVLVAIYCGIQVAMGPDSKLMLFGMEDFAFHHMRKDARLTGPFGAPGITAEFFVIMICLLANEVIHTKSGNYRRALVILLAVDVFLLMTTANRGGFVVLVAAAIMFVYYFRRELGPKRVIGLVAAGTLSIALIAVVATNYTEFGSLFDRLAETEVEEGIPDTRQVVWPAAWREIKLQPILGHGPRLRFPGEGEGRRYTGHAYIRFPHNLYLYMLVTVGVVGLIAFLVFIGTLMRRCWRVIASPGADPYLNGLAKTGFIILVAFLFDQIKISFLRVSTTDYWQFMFALFGFLLAVSDRARMAKAAEPTGVIERKAWPGVRGSYAWHAKKFREQTNARQQQHFRRHG